MNYDPSSADYLSSSEFWRRNYVGMSPYDFMEWYRVNSYPVKTVSQEDVGRVREFVHERMRRRQYRHYEETRNQKPENCMRNDFDGKIGEFVAQQTISDFDFLSLSKVVDLEVYEKKSSLVVPKEGEEVKVKDWSSDLASGSILFPVKSFNCRSGWFPTWIIQDSDRGFYSSNNTEIESTVVVFVVLDVRDDYGINENKDGVYKGRVVSFTPLRDLVTNPHLFECPKKWEIAATKRAIYLSSLIKSGVVKSFEVSLSTMSV